MRTQKLCSRILLLSECSVCSLVTTLSWFFIQRKVANIHRIPHTGKAPYEATSHGCGQLPLNTGLDKKGVAAVSQPVVNFFWKKCCSIGTISAISQTHPLEVDDLYLNNLNNNLSFAAEWSLQAMNQTFLQSYSVVIGLRTPVQV